MSNLRYKIILYFDVLMLKWNNIHDIRYWQSFFLANFIFQNSNNVYYNNVNA